MLIIDGKKTAADIRRELHDVTEFEVAGAGALELPAG